MATNDLAWRVGFKWTVGDASNPTGAIVCDATSKALHFCEPADVATDWNVAAATHPTWYIHSATTPATDYISLWHDATSGFINVASGTLAVQIAAATVFTVGAAGPSFPAGTDLTFTGTTGTNDIVLTNALADALSITDGSADIMVFDTSTVGNVITITAEVRASGLVIGGTEITISDGDGSTNLIPEVQSLGVGTAFAGGSLVLATFNATNTRAVSPHIALVKGAAATQVATTAVADDEVIGSIIAYGSDSSDFETPVGAIEFVVDDVGAPGAGAIGGSIEFSTTADGGETLTKVLTMTSAQAIVFASGATLDIGTSGTALSFAQGSPVVDVYLTNASTNGSNSVTGFYVQHTMTGAGGVGGRAHFYMTTNVALGGWSNALKAEVVYGASGSTSGLGSALLGELTLSAGTTVGTYAAIEAELNAPASAVAGTAVSFLYMNCVDTAGVINTANGYLFELGTGVTDTAGGIFEAEVNTDSMSMTHVLKIRISGTAYYIPLNTSKAF